MYWKSYAFRIVVFLHARDLREIKWKGVAWIQMTQDRVWWQTLLNTELLFD
jgi:hypothetical protein